MTQAPSGKRPARSGYTIRDIAQMAGVSRSTVSLALNNSPRINKETKKRVLELIEQVGYLPNQMARNLVRQKSNTFLVILPPIDHVFASNYFSEALSGILDGATSRHQHLMVELATDEFKSQQQGLTLFRQGSIDGALCVGALTTDDYLSDMAEAGCPMVLVNSTLGDLPNVLAGNEQAASRAVKYLASLGHQRIGHIRGSDQVTWALERSRGFARALEELNVSEAPELIAQGFFGRRSGAKAMKQLLDLPAERRPTAVFCANDMMAIGAMQAIRDAGMSVPTDIAVFGADDIPLAQYVTPGLSTIRQDMYAIGHGALDLLGKYLDGEKVYSSSTPIGMRLVIRESCGARAGTEFVDSEG